MADSPAFKVSVKPETGLVHAIEACPAGGTVEIAPGYYQVCLKFTQRKDCNLG